MKKQKGSLLQRMMAVLLSAVLVTGMVSNAVPVSVLAEERGGASDSVSGNDAEPTEEETEPAEGTNPEEQKQEMPDTDADEETSEEPDAEAQDTVSENDADSVSGNDGNLEAQKANMMARTLSQPVAGRITSNMTWTNDSTVSEVTIAGGTEGSPVVITVEGSVTVTNTITVSSGYVQFTGGGSLNWQPQYINNAIIVADGANAAFESVVLDGSNVKQFNESALLFQGTVTFGNGTTVQNFSSKTGSGAHAGYKGVIAVHGKGSLTVTEGVTITGNSSTSGIIAIYQSDTGGGESTASVTMSGGTIAGNTVNNSVLGVIWNWCGKLNISGGTVTAEGNEYAVHTQGNGSNYDATTVISGGTFTGNTLGAVCAGKDSTNNSRITITGGTFTGAKAATVNYGEIYIEGGSFTGKEYALQTLNDAGLNVAGGEFYGETTAYSGNVTTTTKKVIVGTSKESAKNWDRKTNLNTYKYVAIGELTQPLPAHTHDGMTFTPWERTDSLPTTAGNYYLTENINLNETWNVPSGATSLCLNGKTICAQGKYRVITIGDSSTLNLYDCTGGGNITGGQSGGVDNRGTLKMYGGKISGNSTSGLGAGVYTEGSFYLYGGEISGNINSGLFKKSSVYVLKGIFTIGGSVVISGNVCDGKASNVYLEDGVTITIDSSNPLSDSASIGIMTKTAPTDGSPVNITGANGADYSKYFTSDSADYKIVNGKNNVVQLASAKSDFDKLVETMQIVMAALKDYKATNETTGENIQDIIDAAINKAGITDATVEVRDFQKTEATSEAEGSVQAKIYVECGTKNNTGDLTAKIDRLQPSHTHTLTRTEAKNATCTEEGNSAYYTCSGCGKYFTDAEGTSETKLDSVKINALGHDYNTSEWGYKGADGHAHKCRRTGCGEHDTVVAHTPGEAATETTPQTCTVCGYELSPAIGHTHHYGDWQHDSTQHWKVCSCGVETGRGNHDFGDWVTDQEATATEAGTKHRECQTCGYRQIETIPATGGGGNSGGNDNNGGNGSGNNNGGGNNSDNNHGDSQTAYNPDTAPVRVTSENQGNIVKEVTIKAEDTFNAAIAQAVSELADIVLTQEERELADDGANIKIVLDIQDAQNTVSAADKAVVESALNTDAAQGFTVGQYLDVNLFKVINDNRSAIRKTNEKIIVTIAVPDRLKNTDADRIRTFAVIRVHDGAAEVLNDLDNSDDTISIATDRFSSYAIVYNDTVDSGVTPGDNIIPNSQKDNEPKTGDVTPLELYATVAMIAGFAYLLLYFADRERGMTEETKRELIARLVGWAKQGGKLRKCLALAAIFILLVYYHSIGKKMCAEWKVIYGE